MPKELVPVVLEDGHLLARDGRGLEYVFRHLGEQRWDARKGVNFTDARRSGPEPRQIQSPRRLSLPLRVGRRQ